jgi:predicted  nucleic acid-binding Zn-ribbon protein
MTLVKKQEVKMLVSNIVKEMLEVHNESMKQLEKDFETLLGGTAPHPDTILKVKEASRAETDKHLARLEDRREKVLEAIDREINILKNRRTSVDIEIRDLKRRIKKQKEKFTAKANSPSSVEDESTTPLDISDGGERGEIEL